MKENKAQDLINECLVKSKSNTQLSDADAMLLAAATIAAALLETTKERK
jgi:hypothetical protein